MLTACLIYTLCLIRWKFRFSTVMSGLIVFTPWFTYITYIHRNVYPTGERSIVNQSAVYIRCNNNCKLPAQVWYSLFSAIVVMLWAMLLYIATPVVIQELLFHYKFNCLPKSESSVSSQILFFKFYTSFCKLPCTKAFKQTRKHLLSSEALFYLQTCCLRPQKCVVQAKAPPSKLPA